MSTPGTEPRFPFVWLDVAPEHAELATSELFDAGAQGVEERDATTLLKGRIEGFVTLVANFADDEEANAAVVALKEFEFGANAAVEHIVGDAWRDAWKEHFKPFAIAPGLVIRPPWEAYEAQAGERVLELEPGRAFGTGLHETTSLVAQGLVRHAAVLAGAEVLDVGTGSGILSLVALSLGAARARAIDNDADVIGVVLENAELNGMSAQIDADTTDVKDVKRTYPIVLANIEAGVLIPMAPALRGAVSAGGLLFLSGILVPQRDSILAAYAGMQLIETPEKGEWISVVLRQPG